MAPPANHPAVSEITRPAIGGSYSPRVYGGNWMSWLLDGRPRFTWLEAERMRWDPQIQFGLHVLRAPLWGVTWSVSADSDRVARWVDRETYAAYRKILPRVCRFFMYGVAGGETTYKVKKLPGGKCRIHFDDFHEFHPRDMRPIVHDRGGRAGKLACLRVDHVGGAGNSPWVSGRGGNSSVYIDRRHAFWFRGEAEFGDWWGRPRLAGAFEPWLEKRGRFGAVDSRRLFYKKAAFRGPSMRHPIGSTDVGDDTTGPIYRSNADIAREIVEKFENGGVVALPNIKTPNPGSAPGGDYAWVWEDPKSFPDVAGLRDYPKDLDQEILVGFGIPPELVAAATVGSGYSGRAIPAQVFFRSMDEVAGLILAAIDEQIIRPLVRWNFGRVGYQVKVNSLAEMVEKGPGEPGGGGAGGGQPQPGGGAAGGGMVPYQGPRGGIGQMDPRTGHVHYGRQRVKLSLTARREKRERREQIREAVRLSWSPYQGPKGGKGWVSETGEVRYQEGRPEEESRGGVESVFAAHPNVPNDPRQPHVTPEIAAGLRDKWSKKAAEYGIDGAEMHRRAASHLDADLHAQGAAIEKRKADFASLDDGVKKRAIDAGIAPVVAHPHGLAMHDAYTKAHSSLVGEKNDREAKEYASAFADDYFNHDDAKSRAKAYLEAVDSGELDTAHLDADTRAAISEDLATLPRGELASHAAAAADNYGTADDDGAWSVAKAAVDSLPPAKQEQFHGADEKLSYGVVTPDMVNEDEWAGIQAAAKLLPTANALTGDNAIVFEEDSPFAQAITTTRAPNYELVRHDEGGEPLFNSLTSPIQVGEHDVPASAKNYGGTSGNLNDAAPDDSWNPNNVDCYRRIDKGGQFYLMKRSEGNPDHPNEGTYAIVHRKDVPSLSRLPDKYWDGLDTTPGHRDELVEEAEKRAEKNSPEQVAAKRDATKVYGTRRDIAKMAGRARGEHQRTGNLVRSDEALRARAESVAGDLFSQVNPGEFEASGDRLGGPAEELEAALAELRDHHHDHDYDPDGIDFDLSDNQDDPDGTREDMKESRGGAIAETGDMDDAVNEARETAAKQSAAFRSGLKEHAAAVRAAAHAILNTRSTDAHPSERDGYAALRETAEKANKLALKLLGRLNRKVKMSFGVPPADLWERCAGPILVEVGA